LWFSRRFVKDDVSALDRDGVALESFAGLPDFVSSGHLVGTNQNSPSH